MLLVSRVVLMQDEQMHCAIPYSVRLALHSEAGFSGSQYE